MSTPSPLWPDHDASIPTIIAGPCSAESEEQVLETARRIASQGVRLFRAGIWKPRTKPGGFEGVGAAGLPWLARVKEETGMRIATEVATKEHVRQALAAGVDLLWIGARTSVNPFAVQEIADALQGLDVPVLIKNPVNPDLELWIGAIQRIQGAGIRRIGAVHRGFSSCEKNPYRNLPLWHIPLELKRRMPEVPVFCDPSHIGGKSELVIPLGRQAIELNFNGLMVESHCTPETAWSDAAQQIPPEMLELLLAPPQGEQTEEENLSELRLHIDRIDEQLLELLARRMRICCQIGVYKKEHGLAVRQAPRYNEIMEKRIRIGETMALSPGFVKDILKDIHEESVRQQMVVTAE